MILLFKLIILTVIIVIGLKIAMSEQMVLEKLGIYFERKVKQGYKIFDLFICPWCMGTLQAVTAHAFAFGLGILPLHWNYQLLIRYPLVVLASSLIDGTIWTVHTMLNSIKDKNDAECLYFKALLTRDEESELENKNA